MLTVIEKVLLLQSVEVFSELPTEQLSILAAIAQEGTAEPRQVIYQENDSPDGLYIVIKGTVRMSRGPHEIARVGANQAFGILALFDNGPRAVTAETTEETDLLFIGRDEFYDVLSDNVELVEELFRHLVRDLRRLTNNIDPSQWRLAY
jgi:CRP-like cAMP-binding protein